jgi:hypothetical protein
VIGRTVADRKALAASAGVSGAGFEAFTRDFNALRDGVASLRHSTYDHFEDPGLYDTQHLRGSFRGWGVRRAGDEARLRTDIRAVTEAAGGRPAGRNRGT